MMFWYHHDLSAWWWVGTILPMIAFWGLVAAAVVWLLRGNGGWRAIGPQEGAPVQLTAERFARDEIDEVEYRDRLAALRGEPRHPAMRQ